MWPSLYYMQQHKNSPRSGEQIFRKINYLEGVIGRHLTLLNKQDGGNNKFYGEINSEPSSVSAKDTFFYIINKHSVCRF